MIVSHRIALIVISPALMFTAGCSGKTTSQAANGSAEATNISGLASPTVAPAAAPRQVEANGAPTAAPPVDLAAYVGKYPFDKVGGTSFLDAPAVRRAVAATVPDKAVRDWIFEKAGPQSPIVLKDGKLLAWGCQQHNCGAHNWTIAIDPAGTAADICYFDETTDTAQAKWYLASGGTEMRKDSCPSGSN